ncbi:MAG TPA: hypothetical protein EYP14_13735 [Planctomycetaceae bacterium]|nr:hypothetical protein [Planctomycetaceae bacterium]
MAGRKAEYERTTKETRIKVKLVLDGEGKTEIETGMGALTLRLPRDVGVRVEVRGPVSHVTADEGLTRSDDVYVNEAYGTSDRTVDISLTVGVGAVRLELGE